jgi:hypothetical protein
MVNLTKAQAATLHFAQDAGIKSKNFFADFGHRLATLEALEKRGYMRAVTRDIFGRTTWTITDAGRSALANGGRDKTGHLRVARRLVEKEDGR